MPDEVHEVNETTQENFLEAVQHATVAARAASAEAENLRYQNRRGRILLAIFWAAAVMVAINLHDEHIRRCMTLQEGKTHAFCDVIFPFHDHDDIQDHLRDEVRETVKEELDARSSK